MNSKKTSRDTNPAARPAGARGMVLVVVMVVVVMLSLAAYTFAELMLTEFRAAQVNLRQAQARALADSGVEYLRDFVAQPPEVAQQNGGRYNNSAGLQGFFVRHRHPPLSKALASGKAHR